MMLLDVESGFAPDFAREGGKLSHQTHMVEQFGGFGNTGGNAKNGRRREIGVFRTVRDDHRPALSH